MTAFGPPHPDIRQRGLGILDTVEDLLLLAGDPPAPDLDLQHTPPVAGPSSDVTSSIRTSASDALSNKDPVLLEFGFRKHLVAIEDIKAHLRLLSAFRLFEEKVKGLDSHPKMSSVPYVEREKDPKGMWLWFLEMAVERSVSFWVFSLVWHYLV